MTRNRQPWTRSEDDELARLWERNESAEIIAREFQRSTQAIYSRVKVLNLPQKTGAERDQSRREKTHAVEAERVPPVKTDDAGHIAAVVALGGFCAFSEHRHPRGAISLCLPMIWPERQVASIAA